MQLQLLVVTCAAVTLRAKVYTRREPSQTALRCRPTADARPTHATARDACAGGRPQQEGAERMVPEHCSSRWSCSALKREKEQERNKRQAGRQRRQRGGAAASGAHEYRSSTHTYMHEQCPAPRTRRREQQAASCCLPCHAPRVHHPPHRRCACSAADESAQCCLGAAMPAGQPSHARPPNHVERNAPTPPPPPPSVQEQTRRGHASGHNTTQTIAFQMGRARAAGGRAGAGGARKYTHDDRKKCACCRLREPRSRWTSSASSRQQGNLLPQHTRQSKHGKVVAPPPVVG